MHSHLFHFGVQPHSPLGRGPRRCVQHFSAQAGDRSMVCENYGQRTLCHLHNVRAAYVV